MLTHTELREREQGRNQVKLGLIDEKGILRETIIRRSCVFVCVCVCVCLCVQNGNSVPVSLQECQVQFNFFLLHQRDVQSCMAASRPLSLSLCAHPSLLSTVIYC